MLHDKKPTKNVKLRGDMVNHPPHYTSHPSGVECIEVTEHYSFTIGNAIKYLWRADHKRSDIQDLEKAVWYINREIETRQSLKAKEHEEAVKSAKGLISLVKSKAKAFGENLQKMTTGNPTEWVELGDGDILREGDEYLEMPADKTNPENWKPWPVVVCGTGVVVSSRFKYRRAVVR